MCQWSGSFSKRNFTDLAAHFASLLMGEMKAACFVCKFILLGKVSKFITEELRTIVSDKQFSVSIPK